MCVQKVAEASPDRWRQCVKEDPLVDEKVSRLIEPPSCHKTSRLWTLAQDIIIEWEQRKKRRVGEGTPCKSRKTVTLILFYVWVFLYFLVNRRTLQVRLVHLTVALWTAPLV